MNNGENFKTFGEKKDLIHIETKTEKNKVEHKNKENKRELAWNSATIFCRLMNNCKIPLAVSLLVVSIIMGAIGIFLINSNLEFVTIGLVFILLAGSSVSCSFPDRK